MHKKNSQQLFLHSRGITLVEILVVLGLLAILLSIGLPSAGNASSRAELRATAEVVQDAFESARSVARRTESHVAVDLTDAQDSGYRKITFHYEERGKRSPIPEIQEYRLPNSLLLFSEQTSFRFDSWGRATNPGQVLLIARADDSLQSELHVR